MILPCSYLSPYSKQIPIQMPKSQIFIAEWGYRVYWEYGWNFETHTIIQEVLVTSLMSPLLNLFSPLIRWGWGQQLPAVATSKNGAAGWRGGPGWWPSSPPPPSPRRPGWRCVRGGGAHVHHERVRRRHGTLSRRWGVRRQLCFPFAGLLDGPLSCLQPKTQETGEEDVRPCLWMQIHCPAMKNQQSDRKMWWWNTPAVHYRTHLQLLR